MRSEFDRWNELKKKLDELKKPFYIKERDVCYVHVGLNVGREQNGKGEQFTRPVLILKKFGNKTFWGIPLTTQVVHSFYGHQFELRGKISYAILSQMKLFDCRRVTDKIGSISSEQFVQIKKKVRRLLSI